MSLLGQSEFTNSSLDCASVSIHVDRVIIDLKQMTCLLMEFKQIGSLYIYQVGQVWV